MPSPQGQFGHSTLTSFLPPPTELRDRSAPDYLHWFHNEFCPDIAKRGIQVPVIGYREGEMIRTVDGWTRILAGLYVQTKTAPCILYDAPLSASDAEIASFLSNAKRLDMTTVERARFYASTMAAKGWTKQSQLCRELHLDTWEVCRTLKPLEALPPDLLERVDKDICPRAAYALSGLPNHDLMREFADKLAKGLLCVESLEKQVRAIKNGRPCQARPRTLQCGGLVLTVPADLPNDRVAAQLTEWGREFRRGS